MQLPILNKYRHYLSQPFIIFSDHSALRYITTMRDSSGKIGRWLNFLSQFNFTVHHRPGDSQEMLIADILSRMIEGIPRSSEEELAIAMEKPVLRLYKGLTSPVLWYWFCVEPATEEELRGEGESGQNEAIPRNPGRRTHLRVMLKRLQKSVDRNEPMGQEWSGGRGSRGHRMVSAEEVEYLS